MNTINAGTWAQESHESGSGSARRRASQLRKAGYKVTTFAMGPQVTSVGMIKLTMIDIRPGQHSDTFDLPAQPS